MELDRLNRWLTLGANISVLGGVVFLALEISQNTRQLEQSSFNDIYQAYSEMRQSVYTNPQLSELIIRTIRGEDVTDAERLQVEQYISEILFCTVQFSRLATGVSGFSEENLDAAIDVAAFMTNNPIGADYWQQSKRQYPLEFQRILEEKRGPPAT